MATNAQKQAKKKPVHRPTDWSGWGWDEGNRQWYRTRYTAQGTILYDTSPAQVTVQNGLDLGSIPSDTLESKHREERPSYDVATLGDTPTLLYNSTYDTRDEVSYSGTNTSVDELPQAFGATSLATTPNEFETIYDGSRFFKMGRVFKALWSEPLGNSFDTDSSFIIPTKFGEKAYTKIRHFVVIREMQGCSLCLPLNTYNGQGVGKAGVRAEDYAAVYPLGGYRQITDGERMTKDPFPVLIENPAESIDPMSRINFGRVYTVEHNIKVAKVGRIPDEYLPMLNRYFFERIASTDAGSSVLETLGGSLQPQNEFSLNSSAASNFTIPSSSQSYDVPSNDSSHYTEYSYSPGTGNVESQPDLDNSGAITPKSIHAVINGTRGITLDRGYRVHTSKYFKPGHVFKTLWSEPRGEVSSHDGTEISSKFGGKVFQSIRRFIIVASDHGHCQCLPILTYQGQDKFKRAPTLDEHAIIFTGDLPPAEDEMKGIFSPNPIRMIPKTPRDKLEPLSFIKYAKIYTVEHNVKVHFIGHIARESEVQFSTAFDETWNKKRHFGAY